MKRLHTRGTGRQIAAPELVAVGSVAMDVLHTPNAAGVKVLGGSAIHFANAASFFTSVGLVGVVGDDYPHADIAFLRRRGVDFSGVSTSPGSTFLWEGRYSDGFVSRETIRTELGVFANFDPVLPEHFHQPRTLFLAAIEPQLQLAVLKQVKRPKLVAVDTFKLWIDVARADLMKVLKLSDLLFVNDDEVRWLTGDHNLLRGAKSLLGLGPKWVIVKKGEHGSFLRWNKGVFISATYPVAEVTDPTGAGDAFAGGVLGYVTREKKLDELHLKRSLSWASVIGSFYVEGFGPDGLRKVKDSGLKKRHDQFVRMCRLP